jgi:conjugative transfer region protein TrbK
MSMKTLDRLPTIAAVVLIVLVIAACTIHLRSDDNQAPSATSMDQVSDPLAAKLEQCRSVTSEQKDALVDCRKVWAEKRRQFLGQASPNSSERAPSLRGSPLFVPPDDNSEPRLGPPGHGSIPQSGKDRP